MESLDLKDIFHKKLRYFTEKDYRDLMLRYMKYNPEELKDAIKGNQLLMQGIDDVLLREKHLVH